MALQNQYKNYLSADNSVLCRAMVVPRRFFPSAKRAGRYGRGNYDDAYKKAEAGIIRAVPRPHDHGGIKVGRFVENSMPVVALVYLVAQIIRWGIQ